ncbi:chaperone protein dnaJ 10-like isoform X1 [Neltuma alba]|nr:chaperone protein dnaJ 10-like isoform X1 [Prosopis alba]XP_028781582.1 chaperone protein dnaJ 10-like isoform X1 [Prosopis alba]XP_028781584.1 chaperone protein dnaJ 10-like isoform X1 [Prosopis alba]XP_028781585.1 chaperone protein dnaJ 10-like isoform X1 [Prosopis alba]
MDGSGAEINVESHIRLNKDTLMSSLWKLNVVDIEVTLVHVCQMVLKENNVKKEELKARARALKILGKIFQNEVFCVFYILNEYYNYDLRKRNRKEVQNQRRKLSLILMMKEIVLIHLMMNHPELHFSIRV